MSKIKKPALKTLIPEAENATIGVVIPVYNYVGNDDLGRAIYTVKQCSDLPYQLSLGISPRCIATNRVKGEERLDPSIRYVVQMDDDVLVPPHFMSKLVAILKTNEDIAMVSTVMMSPGGRAQNDLHPDRYPPGTTRECQPPGTCFMYDRKKAPIVWDTEYLGSQWEDTDAVRQIWAMGFKTVATGNVVILHQNNMTENKYWTQNKARFEKKWGKVG